MTNRYVALKSPHYAALSRVRTGRHIFVVATFIPTERVLSGLMSAGFVPVDARQALSRRGSPVHARHILRLRRRYETVQLRDSLLD